MRFAWIAAGLAFGACAHAETLTADQLVAKATAVLANKQGPANGTELGTFGGVTVAVLVECGDICPAYTVRVIHFVVPEGKNCATLGGRDMSVIVPHGIAAGPEGFCIPEPLVKKDLWQDHPFHNS